MIKINKALLRALNAYFIRLPSNFGARVYRSTNQSIPDDTLTAIDFDTERWDTGNLPNLTATTSGFWQSANSDRLTAIKAGWHSIEGNVAFEADVVGYRDLTIWHSVLGYVAVDRELNPSGSITTILDMSCDLWMEAGERVELRVYQNSGGALDVVRISNYSPWFSIVRIP